MNRILTIAVSRVFESQPDGSLKGVREYTVYYRRQVDNAWVFRRYRRIIGEYNKSLENYPNPPVVSLTRNYN